ncbi:MAG: LacI family transcriptional regulator [Kiritimatiellales bacterium]|nr:LacI family transcriptional regulator [Kiritimatiellales bacterium]
MAVSQKQIAEKLGVSIALVSRVLSGKALEIGIAPATIDKVMQAAGEMGYVPSAAALTLKGKASRTIGVVVYDFNDPFFGAIIEQLQIQADKNRYSLVLAGFKGRHPDESVLQPLHKHAIDGLIALGSDMQADWLKGFKELPIARIGHGNPHEPSVRVAVDEDDAARQLIEYLTGTGRRNLIYISGTHPAHQLRGQVLAKHAARLDCKLIIQNSDEADSFTAGLTTARKTGSADALVCATDQIAMGALHALHDANSRIAVTGFDDIPAAAQFIPPITTVRQPLAKMAQRAFLAVIEPTEPQEIFLPGQLIIRQTA